MKFEKITFSSYNANHEYIICGTCKITNASNGILQLGVVLDEGIILHEEIFSVEINGIEFDCTDVVLDWNLMKAIIKKIDSQVYTRLFLLELKN